MPDSLEARFSKSLQRLSQAFLDGVRSLDALVDMFGEWTQSASVDLIPVKAAAVGVGA